MDIKLLPAEITLFWKKLSSGKGIAGNVVDSYIQSAKDMGGDLIDLAFPWIRNTLTSMAESAGVMLSDAELEDLAKKIKEATDDYNQRALQLDVDGTNARSNPGGGSYWQRAAEDRRITKAQHEGLAQSEANLKALNEKYDKAVSDRNTITAKNTIDLAGETLK